MKVSTKKAFHCYCLPKPERTTNPVQSVQLHSFSFKYCLPKPSCRATNFKHLQKSFLSTWQASYHEFEIYESSENVNKPYFASSENVNKLKERENSRQKCRQQISAIYTKKKENYK